MPAADPLRDLLDLVLATLDEPGTDRAALAGRANFSPDHLDRVVAAATGESPVVLRRRLLLERAAWQLQSGMGPLGEVAAEAGYGSLAAFSRAFSKAHGVPPSGFAASERPMALPAPNGLHFHAPGGLTVPAPAAAGGPVAQRRGAARGVADRLLLHHVAHGTELLRSVEGLTPAQRDRQLEPATTLVWFEGPEVSVGVMAERLVATLEVWAAAVGGVVRAETTGVPLLPRFARAALDFTRLMADIGARGAWEDAFVDALCEPPELFVHADVLAHVLEYGAARRHVLAAALRDLGAAAPAEDADPILRSHVREAGDRFT